MQKRRERKYEKVRGGIKGEKRRKRSREEKGKERQEGRKEMKRQIWGEKRKGGKWGRKEEAKEKDSEKENIGEKKFFETDFSKRTAGREKILRKSQDCKERERTFSLVYVVIFLTQTCVESNSI